MRWQQSRKFSVILAFLFVGLSFLLAKAVEKTASPTETLTKTEPTVSSASDTTDSLKMAMDEFHQVLATLWHQTFPEKDFQTIREKAPLLQEKLMRLAQVKLPTYLEWDKEKLDSFLSKRQYLIVSVDHVVRAAADTVDSSLASAFVEMHWAYEELEKVFAVPIEELDNFHETLYFLWHKALPQKDYEAIRKTTPVLKTEVDSLMKASLSRNFPIKKEEFEKKRALLKDAVYQLAEVCEKASDEKIEEALSLVHDRFVELNLLLR